MCGGRFSGVTHPYTYKPYTLYRCGCVGSECTYIYSYTIVKECVVADSQG